MMRVNGSEIAFHGVLDRSTVPDAYRAYRTERPAGVATINLAAVERIDSAGAALLEYIRMNQHPPARYVEPNGPVDEMLRLMGSTPVTPARSRHEEPWLSWLGGRLIEAADAAASFTRLAAAITFWTICAPADRDARRTGAIAGQCRNVGSSAIPIVGFLSLVIGVIVVLQSAFQLRRFGADVFVVDLLALSVTREMGPLITAIVVAGRSGAAIAAQIGTMKVAEELDALAVMALDPVRYVMVPMLIGMLISIPLLTALSIMVGIFGGMVVAGLAVDLPVQLFLERLSDAVGPIDLFIGVSKSFFFGAAIVFVACHCGLRSTGGSEGVGKATTRAVVVSIFAVIVLDAVFSLFYFV